MRIDAARSPACQETRKRHLARMNGINVHGASLDPMMRAGLRHRVDITALRFSRVDFLTTN
jgi:hypothetical protein